MKKILIMLIVILMATPLLGNAAIAGVSPTLGQVNPVLQLPPTGVISKVAIFDGDISKYSVIYVKEGKLSDGSEAMELMVFGPTPIGVTEVIPYYRLGSSSGVKQVEGSYDCTIKEGSKQFKCEFSLPMDAFDSPTELIIAKKGATMRTWETKPHSPPIFLSEGIHWLLLSTELGAKLSSLNGDYDGDGVENSGDNCVTKANEKQEDIDSDGRGDKCDNDIDHDGLINDKDNCKFVKNPDQADGNNDNRGDACKLTLIAPIDHGLSVGSIHLDPCLFNPESEACKEKEGGGVNPDDLDGDGVLNEDDECPEEQEKYTLHSLRPSDGVLDGCPNSENDSGKVAEVELGEGVTVGGDDASDGDGGGGCSLTSSRTNFIALALMILALTPIVIRRRERARSRVK